MQLVLIGLSHRTAPVEVREKLALEGGDLVETLHALRDAAGVQECAVLSTCNRTEIYAYTSEGDWQERLLAFLAHCGGVSAGTLQEHVYSFEGAPAVRRLFRVAAGLDSMVLGEGQVLGQVRQAFLEAQSAQTAGTVIGGLFQHALAAGKRVRTETEIGRGAVSVSLAAVRLAQRIFGNLRGLKVLLIGAGETTELTARALLDSGAASQLLICNRTDERAAELARRCAGEAVPFAALAEALGRADIVITSTGAQRPLITRDDVAGAMRRRRGRPLFLIDIAVPRDVAADVNELDDVYLYNIDDLQSVVEQNLADRAGEAERAEPIVEEEVARFLAWLRSLEVGPTIGELQAMLAALVGSEWERLGGRLSHLSERDRRQVDTLIRGIANKLLRHPILHLKRAAETGNGYHEIANVRAIFGLGDEDEAPPAAAPADASVESPPEERP